MDVFDLFAKISLDTSDYEAGLAGAESDAQSFGKSLGSGLSKMAKVGSVALAGVTTAAAGVSSMFINGTGELAEYGDEIDKMSQKLGLSAEAYQEWDAVMKHSGTTMSAMSRGMQTLQKNAVNSAEKFEALGITQEELAEMSTDELFARTIEGLQNMEEGAERTALANELLGGSAKELGALLNTSAEDTKKMKERVHELGGVMSDEAVKAAAKYQDTLQDMQTALAGAKRGIQQEFLPAITDVMDGLTELFTGNDGMPKINEGIRKFVDKMVEALPKVLETGSKIIMSLANAIIENIPQIISAGVKVVSAFIKGIIKNRKKIIQAAKDVIKAFTDSIGKEFPTLKGIMDKIQGAFDAVFGFIEKHGPQIKGILAGILAGFLAYKATIAVFTAMEKAIGLVTTAVKLMNGELKLTSMMNPFSAAAAGVGVLVGAVAMVEETAKAEREARYEMMSAISEEAQQAVEWASQYNQRQKDIYESNADIKRSVEEELQTTKDLYEELTNIVEENGKVKQGYEERAQVIAGELAEALDIDLQYQDGTIQNYDTILGKLDEIILKKQAEALLEANKDAYIQNMKDQVSAFNNMNTVQEEYNATLAEYQEKMAYLQHMSDTHPDGFSVFEYRAAAEVTQAIADAEALREKMGNLSGDLAEAQQAYFGTQDAIADYNNLQNAVTTGTGDLSRAVEDMTNNIIENAPYEVLVEQAQEAQTQLESLIEMRKKDAGVTQEMIEEATKRAAAAIDALKGYGQDGQAGYAEGIGEDDDVIKAGEQMVEDLKQAIQTAQDSHSPSRVMTKEGVNAVLGYGKGVESRKGWLKTVVTSLMEESVKPEFAKYSTEAREWGIDLMKNFIDGIKSEMAELNAAVKQVGQVIADNLEHSHPKKGPMADDYKWMPDMMHLFADGISDNAYLVQNAAVDAFDFKSAIRAPQMRSYSGGYNTGRVVQLLQEIVDRGLDVSLSGGAERIFNVVEVENRRRTKATKYNALSMARV